MAQEAVDMYIKADLWEEAYRLAVGCMAQEDLQQLYSGRAKQLEEDGKLKEAERIYLVMEEPDLAISMYKRAKRYEPMVKLVATYHPDLLKDTHLHLAKVNQSQVSYFGLAMGTSGLRPEVSFVLLVC